MEKLQKTTSEEWEEVFAALDKAGVPDDFLVDRGLEAPQQGGDSKSRFPTQPPGLGQD